VATPSADLWGWRGSPGHPGRDNQVRTKQRPRRRGGWVCWFIPCQPQICGQ
jgi:hypothetical protein